MLVETNLNKQNKCLNQISGLKEQLVNCCKCSGSGESNCYCCGNLTDCDVCDGVGKINISGSDETANNRTDRCEDPECLSCDPIF